MADDNEMTVTVTIRFSEVVARDDAEYRERIRSAAQHREAPFVSVRQRNHSRLTSTMPEKVKPLSPSKKPKWRKILIWATYLFPVVLFPLLFQFLFFGVAEFDPLKHPHLRKYSCLYNIAVSIPFGDRESLNRLAKCNNRMEGS